jgi:hypothetical protein
MAEKGSKVEKGPLYRPVTAGDAEGTAISVAYEIWRAQLVASVLKNGPVAVVSREAGAVQEWSYNEAERIGYYAKTILAALRKS